MNLTKLFQNQCYSKDFNLFFCRLLKYTLWSLYLQVIQSGKAQSLIFMYFGIMQDLGSQNSELHFVKWIWIWKLLGERKQGVGVKEKGVGLTGAGPRQSACQWPFIEKLSGMGPLTCWLESSPVNQVNLELPRVKEEWLLRLVLVIKEVLHIYLWQLLYR